MTPFSSFWLRPLLPLPQKSQSKIDPQRVTQIILEISFKIIVLERIAKKKLKLQTDLSYINIANDTL